MAMQAALDTAKRTVIVNKEKLLTQLRENRTKHGAEYKEAVAGYKASALKQLEECVTKARAALERSLESKRKLIEAFDPEDPASFDENITLVDYVRLQLKVPHDYTKEYDAAISLVEWDTREELELSVAEFTCWVRDEWDWMGGFKAVTKMYVGAAR